MLRQTYDIANADHRELRQTHSHPSSRARGHVHDLSPALISRFAQRVVSAFSPLIKD
jgi:hypothetical protein